MSVGSSSCGARRGDPNAPLVRSLVSRACSEQKALSSPCSLAGVGRRAGQLRPRRRPTPRSEGRGKPLARTAAAPESDRRLDGSARSRAFDTHEKHIGVDGRGQLTGTPARLVVGKDVAVPLVGWAGPWPVDERWRTAGRERRRARFQVVTATGEAHLLALERGTWTIEGTYD